MRLRRERRILPLIVKVAVQGLLLAAAVPRLLSQDAEPRFRRYGVDNGISQNNIYSVLQDRRGFIWFGTQDGLNRFDGFNFKIFKHSSDDPFSISNPYLVSMTEDRDGSLWIGTDGGGLNNYSPATERFVSYRHDPRSPESLAADRVTALLVDKQGRLWVGTPNGLDLFLPATGTFIHYKSNPKDKSSLGNDFVTCLHQDSAGVLWIGTNDGGLNRLDPRGGRFVRLFGRMTVSAVLSRGESGLWIGTKHGLVRMDRENGRIVNYNSDPDNPDGLAHNTVTSLLIDRAGRLWIGTDNGLDRLDLKTGVFVHHRNNPSNSGSLSSNLVRSIFEDRSGGIWVGTEGGGLNYFDPGTLAFAVLRDRSNDPNSRSMNNVWSLWEDESGLIWMGTDGGVVSLDRRTDRRTLFSFDPRNEDSLSEGAVRTICRDRAGVLWAGTNGGGLNRFDPIRRRFAHFRHDPEDPGSLSSDTLRSIFEDSRGNLWIATFGGLDRLDRASNRFEHYRYDPADPGSLSDVRAYTLLEDRSGVLWIGTWGGGLNRFDPASNRFEHFRHEPDNPASLAENDILTIREDASGVLWIGTRGGGLCRLDSDRKTFKTYGIKEGLPNDIIYAILIDGAGNLWLTHNRGLSRFTPGTGAVKTFGVSDGLQSLEFNANACLKSRNGELFFGGVNGVNAFFPDAVKTNLIVPPMVISGLQVFNKPVPIGPDPDGRTILDRSIVEADTVRLTYKDRVVTFEFAALHYAAPEKNEYAYRLEKLETRWNQIGTRRIATYTNLPPGRYVFRVRGSNNDGVWNEQGASLAVWVLPPFWKRLWFQGIALLAVLGSLAAAARYRRRHFLESKRWLEARVEERTAELKATTVRIQEEAAERRRAEEALRRRAAQAALISRVGQRVSRKLEIGPLLQEIVDAIHEDFHYHNVMLLLLDASEICLRLQAIAGGYKGVFPADMEMKPGEGMIGNAALGGRVLVSGDVSRDPHFVRKAQEVTRSEMAIPIRTGERTIGVLDIQSIANDAFDETEVSAMETLSAQIGSAIANARLFEEVQQELAERMRIEKKLKNLTDDLARSNRELELFAYGASHDLQEPLRIVGSYVQLLSRRYKGKLDQDADDFIDYAVDGAIRMQNMINDLLTYSRVGTRGKPFAPASVEIVFNRALLNLQVAIAEKGAVISHDPLPTLTCDETQLIQLFQNLIGNAVKFQDKSGGAPVIKVGAVLRDGEWVFSVRDNGIGIEPQYRDQIFHIFERLHRDSDYQGTGIGLALCRKIVERHGGRIWVESEPGQGSTFFFTIPNR